jgi:hypothetical protein
MVLAASIAATTVMAMTDAMMILFTAAPWGRGDESWVAPADKLAGVPHTLW